MALTKDQKKSRIKELEDKLKKQKSVVFVSIDRVKNKDLIVLRGRLREESADLIISKKTLTKIAFDNQKIDFDKKNLDGQFGVIFGYENEISPAKLAYEFSKENNNFNILGGLLENSFINKEKVMSLAILPSKEILYSQVLNIFNAPLTGFLNVCNGNIKNLVRVLSQIKK